MPKSNLPINTNRYYSLFDSDRKILLDAYDEHATFSMTVAPFQWGLNQPGPSQQAKDLLKEWTNQSRNLLKIKEHSKYFITNHFNKFLEQRTEILYSGKIHIASRLLQLPKTQHIASSFLMDVNLINIPMQPQQVSIQQKIFSNLSGLWSQYMENFKLKQN